MLITKNYYTVNTLPPAASRTGAIEWVVDALSQENGKIAEAGGTTQTRVRSDGVFWRYFTYPMGGGGGISRGDFVLLQEATEGSFNGASAVNLTAFNNSLYDIYKVEISNIQFSANSYIFMRSSSNGGLSYDSGGADYDAGVNYIASALPNPILNYQWVASADSIFLNWVQIRGTSSFPTHVELELPLSGSGNRLFKWVMVYDDVANNFTFRNHGWGHRLSTSPINALQISAYFATFTSGAIKLWGRKS